jgi:hypothetical protein
MTQKTLFQGSSGVPIKRAEADVTVVLKGIVHRINCSAKRAMTHTHSF